MLDCGLSDDCFVFVITQDTIFLYDRDNEKKRSLHVGKFILSVSCDRSNFFQSILNQDFAFKLIGERGFACLFVKDTLHMFKWDTL